MAHCAVKALRNQDSEREDREPKGLAVFFSVCCIAISQKALCQGKNRAIFGTITLLLPRPCSIEPNRVQARVIAICEASPAPVSVLQGISPSRHPRWLYTTLYLGSRHERAVSFANCVGVPRLPERLVVAGRGVLAVAAVGASRTGKVPRRRAPQTLGGPG